MEMPDGSPVFGLISVLLCLLLPVGFTAMQLPPEIQADRHLVRADRAIDEQDFLGAKAAMDAILELQAQHGLELPEQFSFRYAEVLERLGLYDEAIDHVTEYLTLAGRDGEFYREALELLDSAEEMLRQAELERQRAAAAREAAEAARRQAQAEQMAKMVVVPAGTFQMGCVSGRDCEDDEHPLHPVTISRPFALSRHEVTFDEYDRFAAATGRSRPDDEGWGRGRRPVVNVSWDDAQAYVSWLSSETGVRYRLPSEAEWEYAARAGTTTAYSWGNEIGSNRANCDGCGSRWDDEMTAPVGSFAANAWGLHDMHGNVSEWVEDCWHETYAGAPADGSAWIAAGDCSRRVSRGSNSINPPRNIRAASRGGGGAGFGFSFRGFRVARTLEDPEDAAQPDAGFGRARVLSRAARFLRPDSRCSSRHTPARPLPCIPPVLPDSRRPPWPPRSTSTPACRKSSRSNAPRPGRP